MERSGVQPWNVQGYNLRGPSPNPFSETAWLIFDARLARSPTAPRRRQACSFPATLMQGKASAPVGRFADTSILTTTWPALRAVADRSCLAQRPHAHVSENPNTF